ncbi:uncharacterized protein Dvar_00360 [Desulfosarcina variabilis str. Montpellier]
MRPTKVGQPKTAATFLEVAVFLSSAHPEMANLPDIGVARKILSSEYQPYACGKPELKLGRAP